MNIDKLSKLPNQIPVSFNIKVKGLEQKEAGRVFLIFPDDKIIIDLSRNEKGDFYGQQEGESREVIYLPEGRGIILKAVTEKNKQIYTGELDLVVKKRINKSIKVRETTDKEVAARIKQFEQKAVQTISNFPTLPVANNSRIPVVIREDLSAKQFESALEEHFDKKPVLDDYEECCYEMDLVKGKELFENQCKQCHAIHKKIVGPAMAGAESRWGSRAAIIHFIRYPQKVIDGGDEYAQSLYQEYQQYMPNYHHLSDDDVSSILYYIEGESRKYSYADFKEE